jgi:transposase-like protein
MPVKTRDRSIPSDPPIGFPDPDLAAATGTRGFSPQAMRLLLACSRHLALGLAHVLSGWWRRGDPVRAGFAEYMALRTELERQRVINEIVRAKLARFPALQRKHYSPEERFRIIELRHSYGLSRRETAAAFLVDPQTISRWEREALEEPSREVVGTLVRPTPPLRGYDDVVRRLIQRLDALDIGGSARIAHMLARVGLKIGRETVRRYRRAPRPPHPTAHVTDKPRVLRTTHVNHIWTADLTEIKGFLGLFVYKLLVVLDLHSRFPLAFAVFRREPSTD